MKLDLPFTVPDYIVQDASAAESKAAREVFGQGIQILMCWFHLLYNVRKHDSLKKVSQVLKDMVITDLTRLHYCLECEYEPFKAIVFSKWRSHPELKDFVAYVIPQWFKGTFVNWQIFKSPPGFATTNNPLESFNKIIKAQYTNFDEQPLLASILIVILHMIPFYSGIDKEFLFYRVPHKKTVAIARGLDTSKYSMNGFVECSYQGRIHTHTINFSMKSCTCRWFMAFAVCAHLVAACDLYNYELKGYTKPREFRYRKQRGRKPKALTFTESAFASNPMPVIPLPVVLEDLRPSLYLIDENNMPGLPSINEDILPTVLEAPSVEAVVSTKRTYKKKAEDQVIVEPRLLRSRAPAGEKVKRLKKSVIVPPEMKKKVGRPRKNGPALSV